MTRSITNSIHRFLARFRPPPSRRRWCGGILRDLLLVGTFLVTTASALAEISFTLQGQWPGSRRGQPWGLSVDGGFAYIALGDAGFGVFDVANPSNVVRVGGLTVEEGEFYGDVRTDGRRGYLLGNQVVEILDVSIPSRVVRLGWIACGATDFCLICNMAYLLTPAWLQVVDVSNPASTVCWDRDRLWKDSCSDFRRLVVKGATVLATTSISLPQCADAGIVIIDVSNPAKPIKVGHIAINDGGATDIEIVGDRAYVSGRGKVLIFDVSNPRNPVQLGSFNTGEDTWVTFDVVGDTVYVTAGEAGLKIFDASNPVNPVQVGSFNTVSSAGEVHVDGNLAYVRHGGFGNVQIIDVADPAKPVHAGTISTSGYATSVDLAGNFAYVADAENGVQIIDVADAAKPARIGSFDLSSLHDLYEVDVAGKLAYVTAVDGANTHLRIFDVSNQQNPVRVGDIGGFSGIRVVGNLAYLTRTNALLEILDVADPAKPVRIGGIDTGGYEDAHVDVAGNFAFVSSFFLSCVQIIDVSNPINPVNVGYIDTASSGVFQVDLAGRFAYLAGAGGLQIFDVSDPGKPTQVAGVLGWNSQGGQKGDGWFFEVHVLEDIAYTRDKSGLVVFDVSNPTSPVRVGGYGLRSAADVRVAGSRVYLAAGADGLIILQLNPSFLDSGTLLPDRSFRLRWIGGEGNITLETSTDLKAWSELTTQPASTEKISTFTHPPSESALARFYRLHSRP